MFTHDDIEMLIGIIPRGRQNAMTAPLIAGNLKYPTNSTQEKTRELIKYAIRKRT